MRMDVAITVTEDDGAHVVALAGDLDIMSAGRVGVALNRAIRGDAPAVVADLTKLRFLDSAGLAILVNAARRLDRADRAFTVIAPPGPPRRAIELARLRDVLHVAGDAGDTQSTAAA